MLELPPLTQPWLVCVWPGMGGVALTAGEHLAEELEMEHVGDFPAGSAFEPTHLLVEDGLARPGQSPRCPVHVWRNPHGGSDLVVLHGEAQPTTGGYDLACRIAQWARELGVVRVVGLAAMASQMHPQRPSRVFGAATTPRLLAELTSLDVHPLEEGQVTGLNGLIVAAGHEEGIEGFCLLGELPYFASQVQNPKASRVVLGVFQELFGVTLDLEALDEAAEEVDRQLAQLLERMQQRGEMEGEPGADEPWLTSAEDEPAKEREGPALDRETRQRIERLFREAAQDRSKAFELKQELDRLDVFEQYENRFLDLFKRGD